MLIAVIVRLMSSLTAVRKVGEADIVTVLPDFGFDANGDFFFRISGVNVSGFFIVLSRNRAELDRTFDSVCRNRSSFRGLVSSPETGQTLEFDGKVDFAGVYFPAIFNCEAHAITVDMELRNDKSYLDSRDSFLPKMYEFLCVLSAFAAFAFVINSLSHPQFRISVHSCLALAFAVRAISHYASAEHWSLLIIEKRPPFTSSVPVHLWHVFSLSIDFTVNSLLLSGWGIYRTSIGKDDVLLPLNLSWIFFSSKMITSCDSLLISVLFGSVAVSMAGWYVGNVCGWFSVAWKMMEEVGKSDAIAQKKYGLALGFASWFTRWLFGVCVFVVLKCVLSIRSSVTVLVEELFYVALMCIHVCFFWIGRSREGLTVNVEQKISMLTMISVPDETIPSVYVIRQQQSSDVTPSA
jgi:hypothetical protein